MKLKHCLTLLIGTFLFVFAVSARPMTKKKSHFKLITAYSKKIADNEQTNPHMAGTFFVIKWTGDTYPETFFWRGENGWLTCSIDRAKKVTKNGKTEYTSGFATAETIRKGDTLMLTPLIGGRFPIPDEIPQDAKNTLFYKVGGSKWLSFQVKNIEKK